jgi:hypothetical protein
VAGTANVNVTSVLVHMRILRVFGDVPVEGAWTTAASLPVIM